MVSFVKAASSSSFAFLSSALRSTRLAPIARVRATPKIAGRFMFPSCNEVIERLSLSNARTPSRFRQVVLRILKAVTEPSDIHDVARLSRLLLELTSQIHDVVIHDTIRNRHAVAPYPLDQCVATEEATSRFDQRGQHFEFERCK